MFTIFTMLGEDVKAEHTTSDGRIDLVLKTEQSIFIFELKYKKSADTCVLEKLTPKHQQLLKTPAKSLLLSANSCTSQNKSRTFVPPEPPSLLTMLKSGVVLFLYHYEIIVR